nr:unnamed protein product [Naegleria fowleri]
MLNDLDPNTNHHLQQQTCRLIGPNDSKRMDQRNEESSSSSLDFHPVVGTTSLNHHSQQRNHHDLKNTSTSVPITIHRSRTQNSFFKSHRPIDDRQEKEIESRPSSSSSSPSSPSSHASMIHHHQDASVRHPRIRFIRVTSPSDNEENKMDFEYTSSPKTHNFHHRNSIPSEEEPPMKKASHLHAVEEGATTHNKATTPSSPQPVKKSHQQQEDSRSSHKNRKKELLSELLARKHLRLIHATANGNCLFNCISLALAQSEEYHTQIRQKCVDWIENNLDTPVSQDGGIKVRDLIFLKPFQETIEDYLGELRQDKEWADYCCLNALANLLNVQLDVYYVNMLEDGNWDDPSSMVVKSKIKVLPAQFVRGGVSQHRRHHGLKKIRVVYHEELKHYNLLVPQYHTSML